MQIDVAAEHITELEAAFSKIGKTVPGLTVDVVGRVAGSVSLVHPVAGFEVRLQHDEEAGVSLYISSSYAELTRWTTQLDVLGPAGARERFAVRLSEGFVWGDTEFDTADELAAELLGYLQFNLDAVSLA